MERSRNFYKTIRLGYILISVLIGCIAYNSFYEWQEIEALELDNKKIDEFRKEINNINIQPDGNVCPCIAFPMQAGNVKTDKLKDIYNSVTFNNIRNIRYRDSDRCGKETYCKWCNRCIGQSYIATGNAANASEDNCFIARLRERISLENMEKQ